MCKVLVSMIIFIVGHLQAYTQNTIPRTDSLRIEILKGKLKQVKGKARVDCLNDISRELFYIPTTFKQSYYYSKLAYTEAKKINYQYGLAFSLMYIGAQMGVSANAADTIRRAISIGENLHNDKILGWAYMRLTSQYAWLHPEEISLFKKALYHFEKAGDAAGQTEAARELSSVYSAKGLYEEAFAYCDKALVASKKKRTHTIGWGHYLVQEILSTMSELYEVVGDYRSAMAYLMEAKQYGIKNKLGWEMPDIIGKMYDKIGNHDSALYLLKKNLAIQNHSFYPKMFLGESYLTARQYEKAKELFMEYKDSLRWQKFYPQLSLNLGQVYEKEGNYTAALPVTKKGVAAVSTTNQLLDGYVLLSGIYHKLGKDDSAYFYMKKYASLKDSVSNSQLLWRLNEKLYRYRRAAEEQRKATELALLQKDILLKGQLLKEQELLKEQKDAAISLLDKDNKLKQQQLEQEALLKEQKDAKISILDKDNKINLQQLKQESLTRKFLFGGLLILLLTGFFIFRTLSLKRKNEKLGRERTENELKLQKLESDKQHSEMLQQATELEMQALRAQMNPHFIFNCLSSINKYIIKNETDAASDYLTRFSRLIRMVLINSQKRMITLEDELDMLRLYLDMERLRFSNAFDYTILFVNTIEPASIFIPPLLLQPFCENAIWHGLMHKEGHGKLDIALSIHNDMLYCTITDNGIGREKAAELKSKSTERQKSLGLKITNNRLALLNQLNREDSYYEMNDIIDGNGKTGGTQVDFRIRYKDVVEEVNV